MIRLTRLNSQPLVVNCDLVKFVENAPDTVLTLITGEKLVVREPVEEVIQRIIDFRRAVFAGLPATGASLQVPGSMGARGEEPGSHQGS